MPDTQFVGFQEISEVNENFRSILLTDAKNQNYILQTAANEQAIGKFLAEVRLTKLMESHYIVPKVVAENGQIALYLPYTGKAIHPSAYTSGQVKSLAKSLVNLHALNTGLIQSNALPTFTNLQQQRIIMDTLDEAAMTGKIPTGLLERFEEFIDTEANWAYDSTVVNGDLRPTNVLFIDDDVNCVISWHMLRQSDPAYDLAGITPSLTVSNRNLFFDVYRKTRSKLMKHIQLDANLDKRAEFYSQFELVTQLLISKAAGNDDQFAKVTLKLEELDEKLRLGDELAVVEQQARLKLEQQEQQERDLKLQDSLHTEQVVVVQPEPRTDENDTQRSARLRQTGDVLNSSPSLKQIVSDENATEIEQELKKMLTQSEIDTN
jgi:hypothetical protein